MVLDKHPGRLTLDKSRERAYCACSRFRWGLFGHFYSRLSFLSSFSFPGRRPEIKAEILSLKIVKLKTTKQVCFG